MRLSRNSYDGPDADVYALLLAIETSICCCGSLWLLFVMELNIGRLHDRSKLVSSCHPSHLHGH